jgi:hypothetical protein
VLPLGEPVPTYTFPFAIIGVMNWVFPFPGNPRLNNSLRRFVASYAFSVVAFSIAHTIPFVGGFTVPLAEMDGVVPG